MKLFLKIIIILLLVLLQISFAPYFSINSAFPNLVLIFVLSLTMLTKQKNILFWIILGGIFTDISSFNNPIGVSIIGLFTASYVVYFLTQNILKETNIFSLILICIIGTLIYGLILILALAVFRISFQFSFTQILSQIIYNTLTFIPVFYLLKHFIKMKD